MCMFVGHASIMLKLCHEFDRHQTLCLYCLHHLHWVNCLFHHVNKRMFKKINVVTLYSFFGNFSLMCFKGHFLLVTLFSTTISCVRLSFVYTTLLAILFMSTF